MHRDRRSVLVLLGDRLLVDAVARGLGGHPRIRVDLDDQARSASGGRAPDIVLVLGKPGDGLTGTVRSARRAWPRSAILLALDSDRRTAVLPLLQAGADGYVTGSASFDDLVDLIDRAVRGETLLSASTIAEIALHSDVARQAPAPRTRPERLTRREMEILLALRDGLRPRAIAERDQVSRATVRTHVQNILAKLGAHSVLEAVAFSIRHGIVHAPRNDGAPDEDEPGPAWSLPGPKGPMTEHSGVAIAT